MFYINFKRLGVVLLVTAVPLAASADEKKLDLFDVVKSTLDNSPVLKIQGFQVDVSKAVERIQSGAFNVKTAAKISYDRTKNTSYVPEELYRPIAPPPPVGSVGVADSDTQSFQASAEKKFRTGITTKLQYDLSRKDPFGISSTATDNSYGTVSRGKINLTITVPLLKGAWEVSAAAAEKAAGLEYQAAAYQYKFLITSTLLKTINAYWNYTAASRILYEREQILKRMRAWVTDNHLNGFLEGFLREKESSVATATQDLEQARIDLGLVMGIPVEEAQKLAPPDYNFLPKDPEKLLSVFDPKIAKQQWVELALENRNDLKGNKLKVEASEILLAKDQQDLYPELTAAVNVGYNGITHGNSFDNYFNSSYKNVRDLDHSATLTFSYPIGNDVAEGQYDQDQAKKMINTVTMNETARGIKLSVEKSVAAVYGRLKVVVQAQKTAFSYRDSLRDLLKKFDQKTDSASNIVVLQQKLEDAIMAYIRSQADFVNAIAQARFESGVLVSNADDNSLTADFNIEKIISLPVPSKLK
jgi:outer membrane protein